MGQIDVEMGDVDIRRYAPIVFRIANRPYQHPKNIQAAKYHVLERYGRQWVKYIDR